MVFSPSIVIAWILLIFVGLAILSTCLLLAISKVKTAYFTTRMPDSLQFLGYKIVYFGIPKYHQVQEKPMNGILLCRVGLWGLVAPHQPHHVPLGGRRFRRWLAGPPIGGAPSGI